MTESTQSPSTSAPPSPPTPAPGPTPVRRSTISFGRAMVYATLLFVVALVAGAVGQGWIAAVLGGVFVVHAWRLGFLRAQPMVMAEVTWLVLGMILKLAFLEQMPANPLPVLCLILFVQYLAQLGVDLKAFATAGDTPPAVTYAVTFALAPVLCVATELFREARTNYAGAAGVVLAMLIAASFFLLLVVWWDWTRKAFSSLKMAVTLISLIGVGSMIGTLVIQHMPEESADKHYEKFMNGEGAAPVNARYLFQDPEIDWTDADRASVVAKNDKFGAGTGDRWEKMVRHERVKKAKEEEGHRWVAANRQSLHAFYEFCEDSQFSRIFKSWYFNALLVLLASTVVGVMARRWPYEPRDFGWVTTHTGIVFLLLCLAGSDLNVRDGFVQAAPTASPGRSGAPSDVKSFDDLFKKKVPSTDFPFWFRLVRTSADWYQELVTAFVDPDGGVAAENSFPVLAGKVVELERPSKGEPPHYRIEMLDVFERAQAKRVGYRPGKATGVTALELRIDGAEGPQERWITDEGDAPLAVPGGQLRFVVARTAEEADRLATPQIAADTGAAGFVRIVADDKDLVRIAADAGGEADFVHAGKSWHLKIADVALDMNLSHQERDLPAEKRTPLERQIPDIGGATLMLTPAGGEPQRAIALSGRYGDFANEQMANAVLKEAGLRVYLDFVIAKEVRLVVRPDGGIVAVSEDRGVVSETKSVHEGDALPIAGESVAAGKLLGDAELDVEMEALPPETDADYMKNGLAGVNEQVGRPAIRVRITEPGREPYEQWIVGSDPWVQPQTVNTRDHRVRLMLASTSESMYRSAVQAIDSNGHVLAEHVVRVNAPFRMDGYEFYQNSFVRPDQGGPLSVFRVKYDLFVPWIYVGFALVAIGVITLLWFPGQRAFKLHAHLARLPEEGPRS